MASGIELATAYVQIVPSAEGIEGKITEALEKETSSAGDKAGKSLSSSLVKGIATGAAAVGAAAASLVSSITGSAVKVSEYGDNIDKMSQKIGISAESYQKWDYVMQRAGTSVDNLKTGMKTLITAAESGSDAFDKLGISQEQIASMSQEELLEKTIKSLADMEEGAERTALATQLLGKAGMDLGPLLNSGSEAIMEQMQMAEDYGMIMSDEAVAASAVFQDSLTTFKGTIGGMKNSIFSEFLPSMSTVLDGLAMVFAGNGEGMELISEGIDGFIDKIGEITPHVLEIGGGILSSLANAIIEHLPDLVESTTGIINQLITGLTEHLPEIVIAGIQILVALVQGLVQAIPELVTGLGQVFIYLFNTIRQNLPAMLSSGMELLRNLGDGIVQAIPIVVSKIPELISKMIQALKGAITQFISIGGEIMAGLAKGIANGISNVVKGIGDAIGNVVGAAKQKLGIASPSKLFRDEIGENIMLGWADGISGNMKAVTNALDEVADYAATDIQQEIAFRNSSFNMPGYSPANDLNRIIEKLDNLSVNPTVVLDGDIANLFKAIKQEDKKFKTRTGSSRFAY
jgi:hypothetical protein